ncbi:hypothetical protein VTO42DRAFT_6488 [Malbranchea cinnamomea]
MKRQRVSRACDTCRVKKDRCDGARPSCATCSSLQRSCSYKSTGKKRGVPTGYLRTLELLWGLVFSQIRGSEQAVRTLLKTVNIPGQLGQISKDGEGSNTYLSAWKQSSVLKEVERVLASLEQPEEETNRHNQAPASSASPEDSDSINQLSLEWHVPDGLDQRHDDLANTNVIPIERSQTVDPNPPPSRETRDCGVQADIQQTTSTHTAADKHNCAGSSCSGFTGPRELCLPQNARQLFDIYFSYTNSWLPIIEKHEVLRAAFSYGTKTLCISRSQKGSGDHAAMWAILTLASFQHSSRFSNNPQNISSQQREPLDSDALYGIARWLIPPEDDGSYELGHVQALLILSLVKFGQQQWSTAWNLIGFAIRIAMGLGLCHPFSSRRTPRASTDQKNHGKAKHVFLACFVLDTLIAMEMGCSPLLRKEDVSRVGPLDEDGLEEWHPWEDQAGLAPNPSCHDFFGRGPLHALSTFNRLVSLMCILNDFCCSSREASFTDSDFENLERRMRHWASNLEPKHCITIQENNNISVPTAPHVLGLHLAYEGTLARMNLDRRQHREKGLATTPSRTQTFEGTTRLVTLIKAYVDNYSLSATSPTLLIFLPVGSREADASLGPNLSYTLQTMATQLSLVWRVRQRAGRPQGEDSTASGGNAALVLQRPQGETASSDDRVAERSKMMPAQAPPRTSLSSVTWVSHMPPLDASSALSMQPPTPSLNRAGTDMDTPGPDHGRFQHPIPSLSTSLQPSLHTSDKQYQRVQNEPSINTDTFVDMDEYSVPRQTRIAPDLDALLDELDSLEETDKPDHQPVFMRNLGFAPNSGVSELYTYSSQLDPFMLHHNTTASQDVFQDPRPPPEDL